MKNFKNFLLLYESYESQLEKYTQKIKKITTLPVIIDWVLEKCNTENSIKYSVWLTNELIKQIDIYYKDSNIRQFLKIDKNADVYQTSHASSNIISDVQYKIRHKVTYILDWLANPERTEKVNLKELTLDEAYKKSDEWHKSLKASGKIVDESGDIIITFDDGYYWIDLKTNFSSEEKEAMGHCGRTKKENTLISLRDNNNNKEPHVTIAYNKNSKTIEQIKGKNNTKPVAKYYSYIFKFLIDKNIDAQKFDMEYDNKEDFSISDFDKKTFDKIFEMKPDLVINWMSTDSETLVNLIKKDYLSDEQIQIVFNKINNYNKIEFIIEFLKKDSKKIKQLIKDLNIDFDLYSLQSIESENDHMTVEFNEYTNIMLWRNKIISDGTMLKLYHNNFKMIDDNLMVIFDDNNMSQIFDDNIIEHIFGEAEIELSDYLEMSFDNMFDYISKENKQQILNLLDGTTIENEGESITFDKETCKITKYSNFTYGDDEYDLVEILDENVENEQIINDLYLTLNNIFNQCYNDSFTDSYFKHAKKEIESIFGGVNINYDEREFYFHYDNFDWSDIISFLDDKSQSDDLTDSNYYNNITEVITEEYNKNHEFVWMEDFEPQGDLSRIEINKRISEYYK